MVAPYTVAELLPANASRKLAVGSGTDVWPPRTTRPVIPTLPRGVKIGMRHETKVYRSIHVTEAWVDLQY